MSYSVINMLIDSVTYCDLIFCFVQDGEILMSNSRVHVDSMLGMVYFTPLHKDDEGGYNCTAFNDVGAVSSANQLRVYGMTP